MLTHIIRYPTHLTGWHTHYYPKHLTGWHTLPIIPHNGLAHTHYIPLVDPHCPLSHTFIRLADPYYPLSRTSDWHTLSIIPHSSLADTLYPLSQAPDELTHATDYRTYLTGWLTVGYPKEQQTDRHAVSIILNMWLPDRRYWLPKTTSGCHFVREKETRVDQNSIYRLKI